MNNISMKGGKGGVKNAENCKDGNRRRTGGVSCDVPYSAGWVSFRRCRERGFYKNYDDFLSLDFGLKEFNVLDSKERLRKNSPNASPALTACIPSSD